MLKPDIPNDALTRIIVADDGGVEHLSFCSRLGDHRNFAVRNASDWPGLKVLLDDRRQDVVIIGVSVGGMSGIEINSKIKSFSADPPATIMLDAAGNVHAAIKAFRCGFTDYLIKGSTGDRALYEAILRASRIVRAERAKAENLRYLEWLAQRDGLTGLPNRHCLDERLEQLLQIGVRHNAPFAAVLIRFNEYEYVNSAFGYKIGDQALHAFANKLKSAMRKSDTVGRLDRDTFLYLVDRDVTEQGIKGVCARLAEAAKFSLELDTLSLTLTASVAAAVFPNNGTSVAELLDAAERALPPASGVSGAQSAPTSSDAATTAGSAAGLATAARVETDAARPAPQAVPAAFQAHPYRSDVRAGLDNLVTRPNSVPPAHAGEDRPSVPLQPKENRSHAVAPSVVARAEDRRIDRRQRVLKRGSIVFNDGFCAINCVIRDLSSSGARIAVDGQFNAPQFFELLIADTGKRHPVEKRWQRGNEFGLKFRQ